VAYLEQDKSELGLLMTIPVWRYKLRNQH